MSDSENCFEEIVDLLSLLSKGINIDYFEHTAKNRLAGHYDSFWNTISINREIIHYWSATFTTVLHEFKHFQQRRAVGSTIAFFIVIAILGYLLGNILPIPTNLIFLLIYELILVVFGFMILQFYFERGAKDYEARFSPDIVIFLSQLEFVEISMIWHARKKVIRENLEVLFDIMKKHTQRLLELST